MILHCVFCKFQPGGSTTAQTDVLQQLAEFSGGLDGVVSFDFGPNRDFEGKSQGYTAGFVIRFSDKAALDRYAIHPTHKALGAALCDLCEGGADGIKVYDLEV